MIISSVKIEFKNIKDVEDFYKQLEKFVVENNLEYHDGIIQETEIEYRLNLFLFEKE